MCLAQTQQVLHKKGVLTALRVDFFYTVNETDISKRYKKMLPTNVLIVDPKKKPLCYFPESSPFDLTSGHLIFVSIS